MAFEVSPQLQAMIAGFTSKAVANVAINRGFDTSVASFPTSPTGQRRSLVYSVFGSSQYNVDIANLDGSNPSAVTLPR